MNFKLKTKHALLAAALIAAPTTAMAQNEVADQAEEVNEQTQELREATNELNQTVAEERNDTAAAAGTGEGEDRQREDRDDDGFDWGLLGLLGLAGLLGLKRRDDDHGRRDYDRDRAGTTGPRGTSGDTDRRL